MARNGSGVYSLPAGSTVTNGDTSDATDVNTPLADIATDLNTARPIVAGGTGATSASAARTALGLVIGTNVQAWSALLDSIAAGNVDATEFGYLDGVSSAIQTQIDAIPAVIDEDDFTSDSATRPPSQQSTKAYVDAVASIEDPTTPVSLSGSSAVSQDGIPATATKFTVVFESMSTVSNVDFKVQVRVSASDVTTGYDSSSDSNLATASATDGMIMIGRSAASNFQGSMTFRKKPSTNLWVTDHNIRTSGGGGQVDAGGVVSGVTVATGSGNFDGGSFWVEYS